MKARRVFYSILVFIVIFFLLIFVGETIVRYAIKIPPPPYNNKEKNALLGWIPKANYHFITEYFPDNKHGVYPVSLKFKQHGFRKWSEVPNDSTFSPPFPRIARNASYGRSACVTLPGLIQPCRPKYSDRTSTACSALRLVICPMAER